MSALGRQRPRGDKSGICGVIRMPRLVLAKVAFVCPPFFFPMFQPMDCPRLGFPEFYRFGHIGVQVQIFRFNEIFRKLVKIDPLQTKRKKSHRSPLAMLTAKNSANSAHLPALYPGRTDFGPARLSKISWTLIAVDLCKMAISKS
jgi:hypothetical protein